MAHLMPTRALDSVYDPVYTVPRSGGRFSKGVYRASGSKPPTAATSSNNNNSNNNSMAGYAMVSGAEQPKFFCRPILPHLQAESPEVLLSPPVPAASTSSTTKKRLNEEQHEMESATTRSVGIQIMYRDSDAQTDPYTPDYTIKKTQSATTGKEPPEVLSLLHLHHNQGLPAGQAEIELME
ncbi:Protein maats1, partial [Globisporangium splendens]